MVHVRAELGPVVQGGSVWPGQDPRVDLFVPILWLIWNKGWGKGQRKAVAGGTHQSPTTAVWSVASLDSLEQFQFQIPTWPHKPSKWPGNYTISVSKLQFQDCPLSLEWVQKSLIQVSRLGFRSHEHCGSRLMRKGVCGVLAPSPRPLSPVLSSHAAPPAAAPPASRRPPLGGKQPREGPGKSTWNPRIWRGW